MRFLTFAWRNTLRNPRRSSLTVAAIATGVGALALAWALFDGGNAQMIENMTASYSGYVQVHRAGYDDDPNLDAVIAAPDILPTVARAPHVTAASGRLESRALISTDQNARGILLAGIAPERERAVTYIHTKLIAGRYLQGDERGAILLGATLATTLGVNVGGEVAIVTQGFYGSVGAERYRVAGLYETGNEMVDNMQAFITLAAARDLLGAGDELTSVAIKLDRREATENAVRALQTQLGAGYEVLGWPKLLPAVAQSMSFHEGVVMVVMGFLFGIVALGVANSILMSVTERQREFGVMLSIGTTPYQLFRSIMYEGFYIGMIGFVVGSALGAGIVAHFAADGIHFGNASGMIKSMQADAGAIYPTLSWSRIALMATGMLVVAVVASLFPALKTARLAPLQALHGLTDGPRAAVSVRDIKSSRHLLMQLAMRNIRRQPMRTRLTIGAITFTLTAFIFLGSIAIGYFTQTIDNATGTISGDAQVMQPAFKAEMKASLAFPGAELLHRVEQVPGVQAVAPRAQTQAMISIADRSEPLLLIGVSPEHEPKVTFMNQAVHSGRYLSTDDDRAIVIGVKLAELLRVGTGDKVVITAQDREGKLTSEAYVVRGIFDTSSQGHGVDRLVGYVPLHSAQRLLALGDDVTNLAVRFSARDDNSVSAGVKQIDEALGDRRLTIFSWQQLLPEVVQMRTLIKKSLVLVLAIVLTMVAVVVMNTTLMSVMERTREFGIMLALGSAPSLIVRLVLLESAVLGLFATGLGLVLGPLVAALHMANGVSMKAHGMTAIPGVTNVVYPELTGTGVFGPAAILPLVILVAALYPAIRAGRLAPVHAIRHA